MKAAPSSVQYSKHACSRKRGDTYIRGQGYGNKSLALVCRVCGGFFSSRQHELSYSTRRSCKWMALVNRRAGLLLGQHGTRDVRPRCAQRCPASKCAFHDSINQLLAARPQLEGLSASAQSTRPYVPRLCPCRENMLNCCRTHYCCSSNDYKSILDCCPQRLLLPYITPREQAQVANKRAIWCGSLPEQRRKSSFNMPPPPARSRISQ